MKLLVSVFLVLVLLDEYRCDPCLEWLFGSPTKNRNEERNRGAREQSRRYWQQPTYSQYYPNTYPPYAARRNYQPFYINSNFPYYGTNQPSSYGQWNPPNPSPYFSNYGRPFGATYNIPFGRGAVQNGIPYGTSYGGYGGFNRPQNPIRFGGTVTQAPNGPNETPVQTPLETGDGKLQRKLFYVTPDGIRETPAEPLDNVSQENLTNF